MDDNVRAKNLLIGANMKIVAFSGTNRECAKSINEFFIKKNIETYDIKVAVSAEKSNYSGDMLIIISYMEIK